MLCHRHFKLTEQDLSFIFQSPRLLALFIAVFATVIFCTIILLKIETKAGQGSLKILTQVEQIKDEDQLMMIDNYERGVKRILNNYLVSRTSEDFKKVEFCQNLVNQAVARVLALTVPGEDKEFHLQLVVLLDKEGKNCQEQSEKVRGELDRKWVEFLGDYKWLSE